MKKRKILKKISLAGLAVVIGAAGIFAFAPIGASASEPPATTTNGLGLDPKNDPVVYTTQIGLEIKKSNAKYSSTSTVTTNRNYSYTQDLTSFYYFTMGSFSGTVYTAKTQSDTYAVTNEPVNWLIIGRGGFDFYDSTPAGGAIETDSNKQEFAVTNNLYLPLAMQSIPYNDEIPDGCFLVLSEKLLGQMYFNSSGNFYANLSTGTANSYSIYSAKYHGNRYRYISNSSMTSGSQSWNTSSNTGGSLYNYINNLYSKNISGVILKNSLGFTQSQSDLIIPQSLYTFYYNNGTYLQETPSSDGAVSYTMFPLAARYACTSVEQNFCIEDYLPNSNQRVASLIKSNQSYYWWLRSGSSSQTNAHSSLIDVDGSYSDRAVDGGYGVRPAMVMKLS